MIDPGLEGRVALVTGGNNPYGIGAATAVALAAQGATVFIHYFRFSDPSLSDLALSDGEIDEPGMALYYAMQERSAEDVAEKIRESGGRAYAWEGDLAKPGTVLEMFDRAEEDLGPVDILVNNAAHYQADTFRPPRPAEDDDRAIWEEGPPSTSITPESHDLTFAVNTRAVALSMREFARRRARDDVHWGRIVNISADCAWGAPAEVSYRASKYALESYSRAAAAELGPLGITVNVVSPGPIQTGYISPELEELLVAEIPLRRVGTPEDVADAVVYIASEQARWITGQLLFVHGGHRMSMGQ